MNSYRVYYTPFDRSKGMSSTVIAAPDERLAATIAEKEVCILEGIVESVVLERSW